jgi:hypothetical protein
MRSTEWSGQAAYLITSLIVFGSSANRKLDDEIKGPNRLGTRIGAPAILIFPHLLRNDCNLAVST